MLLTVARHVHSILVQMMTADRANSETCPFRVWGTVGFLTLIGFMGVAVWLSSGANFDPASYGGAMAAYLAAWGAAIWAKDRHNG